MTQIQKLNQSEVCADRLEKLDIHERVMNPVQKPKTTPRTIDNCSRAMREPRTSGGLISAMYKGASMLEQNICISTVEGLTRTDSHLNAPTPIPPMARPMKMWLRFCAAHWNAEPMQNMTE